jgi:hypothetical protein
LESDAVRRRGSLALLALAALLLTGYGLATRHGPALADEFIYLAGARHLALTGSLAARFYDAQAILQQGYPHHDVHAPGYVLVLGSLTAAVGGGYATAVWLNVIAYVASAFLVRGLSAALGLSLRAAWVAAALYLVLPAFLPYVFWAMAELVLGALFLTTLFVAAARGERPWGAALAGLLFGLTFLVRESALFGLPAVLGLMAVRGRLRIFLVAAGAFLLLVYVPLSRDRAPGGANFWEPTSGKAFGYESVQAARQGQWTSAARAALRRASDNLRELVGPTSAIEKGILATYGLMALASTLVWRRFGSAGRRLLEGAWLGLAGMLAVLFFVYVVGQWSGFRYLMFLIPALLPASVASLDSEAPPWRRAAIPVLLAVAWVALDVRTLALLNAYKASRQKRQEGIAAYVERYVDARSLTRIALTNGWLFGLRHYPVEVISSLPDGGGELRVLERAVWFDCLVLPGDTPLAGEMESRARYRRLNADDAAPPLLVYRRLK